MLNVGIIGLGQIGYTFGFDTKRKQPQSHYHAYTGSLASKDCKVTAVCDIKGHAINVFNSHELNNAMVTTIPERYTEFHTMMSNHKFDIVSICTAPDTTHFPIARDVITEAKPKVLFLEKPMCVDPIECHTLNQLAKDNNVKIVIDHTRRWMQLYNYDIPKMLAESGYGEVIRVVCYSYGNGLRVWSHMADLINMYKFQDRTTFVSLKGSKYLFFEMDFFCENGKIRVADNGRSIISMTAEPSRFYENINELTCVKFETVNPVSTMEAPILDVIRCANSKNAIPFCTGEDGMKAVETCMDWARQAGYSWRDVTQD